MADLHSRRLSILIGFVLIGIVLIGFVLIGLGLFLQGAVPVFGAILIAQVLCGEPGPP